jgi:hypothetical protein
MLLNLDILKCDRNPLEWPPRAVLEPLSGINTASGMKNWIRSVQKWMESNPSKSDHVITHALNFPRNGQLELEDSMYVSSNLCM